MKEDFFYPSKGAGQIHVCRWSPDGDVKAVVQIVHGIADFAQRYDGFARYLNKHGILAVAEDHMGHGQSVNGEGIQGYFHGGWFTAVEDTVQLTRDTMTAYPGIPYVLFGHSMGSFMARTILCAYSDLEFSAAVICGTGWQPAVALPVLIWTVEGICRKIGETNPSKKLQNLVFGSYNRKVEHPRTPFDWVSRDRKVVDDYIADPMCGFIASSGLLRDMLKGIYYIQLPQNLQKMKKALPVFFIAGGDDPVGNYGKGIRQTAAAFAKANMTDVAVRIYPLCRHEILNEINREEIYKDIVSWIKSKI